MPDVPDSEGRTTVDDGNGAMESTGAELIEKERARQISDEGWTVEHDAEHVDGELLYAASCYLEAVIFCSGERAHRITDWPWEESSWKPHDDPVRNLVKAGALIAAEIDRLTRDA